MILCSHHQTQTSFPLSVCVFVLLSSLHSSLKSQEGAGKDEAITPELKIELLKAFICYTLTVL